jgi:bifunctional non-homologous end joining protein LigD
VAAHRFAFLAAARYRRRVTTSLYPPGFVEPCLPTISRTVPTGRPWAYEIKHDGFRFLAVRQHQRVRVFSRNGRDWTDRVPLIVGALTVLKVKSVTIRREGTALPR